MIGCAALLTATVILAPTALFVMTVRLSLPFNLV